MKQEKDQTVSVLWVKSLIEDQIKKIQHEITPTWGYSKLHIRLILQSISENIENEERKKDDC